MKNSYKNLNAKSLHLILLLPIILVIISFYFEFSINTFLINNTKSIIKKNSLILCDKFSFVKEDFSDPDKSYDFYFTDDFKTYNEYYYIINDTGKIKYSTQSEDKLCYYENLFEFFDYTNDIAKTSLIDLNSYIQNAPCNFEFKFEDKNRTCFITKIPNTNLYLISLISNDIYKSQQKKISSLFYIFILFCVVFLIAVLITFKNNLNSQNKEETNRFEILSTENESLLFELDFPTNQIEFTGDCTFLFGKNKNNITITDFQKLKTKIHPDDSPIIEKLHNFFKQKQSNFICEFRLLCSNNIYKWFRLNGATTFDYSQNPLKFIGNLVNVNAEQAVNNQTILEDYDPLSNLLKKDVLEKKIQNYLTKNKDISTCALFLIDLDNFKTINDRLGHSMGDFIIKEISKKISRIFSNIDYIGRIGGDEFCVLLCLKNVYQEEIALKIINEKANNICNSINEIYSTENDSFRTTASIGISLYPYFGTEYNQLLKFADTALYSVKLNGKNGFKIYNRNLKQSKDN